MASLLHTLLQYFSISLIFALNTVAGLVQTLLQSISISGLLQTLLQSISSKAGEKVAEYGWEAMTGNKYPKSSENRGELLLTTRLTGEMFEKNVKAIWEWLVNDKVKSIGIYGMGGVGKTTLAKHINNRLRSENRRVYWVTVSQVFTTNKLQSDIAKVVDLDLSDEENEDKRAARLHQALSKKEDFVLILDDVWSDIDLKLMGDPLGVEFCRLIVTTRSLKVCQRIDCEQNIEVNKLQTNESWTLFRETLGGRTTITSEVEEIARLVAEECDGLPLGIIVLAKRMRGVTDIREWRNVHNELSKFSTKLDEMKEKVFRVLKYSFDRLDSKLQLCFLYCSLYPEDYKINKGELVRRFISDELVDTRNSWEEKLDQGHTMLNELVGLCLLESTGDSERVKMHDLVRDMALSIVRECPKYKVFAGRALKEIPKEGEWTEDVDKISLMRNRIQEIPMGMAPNCPKLATLLLNENPLTSIPESFFAKMSGLLILDLSDTSIRELPNSLSDLESLNTLLLNNCLSLFSLPFLGKLKALRELDLSGTLIRELPNSLSDLESLNTLLLYNCRRLVSLPFLDKLKALRELDLSNTSITQLPNSISDLESVYRLCLSGCRDLVFVPSLGKLEALRELDLSHTSIKQMPKGMKNLINLKILLFRGTKNLKLQPGDLPIKSRNLQHLEFPFEIEVPVHEIESFKQLNRFVGRFKDVSDFNWFQSQTGGFISKFTCLVGNRLNNFDEDMFYVNGNCIGIEGCNLREGEDIVIILAGKVQWLQIMCCEGLSSYVFDDFKASSSSVIEDLTIGDCEGIESIWNINDQLMAEKRVNVVNLKLERLLDLKGLVNWEVGGGPDPGRLPCPPQQPAMIFSCLKKLYISGCHKMKMLGLLPCPPPQPAMIFSCLKKLYISGCHKMKTLGLPLPCLHNITSIEVVSCYEIEELIKLDEDNEEISEPTHSLPSLKDLTLMDLPKLKSICKARIDCKSIEKVEIRMCPSVKKLGLPLPCLHNITSIQVSYCDKIEELIELDEDYEGISEPTLSLPSLKDLAMLKLPKLKSICKARIECKSIERIKIWGCRRVKKLPLFLPSSSSSNGQVINYSPPPALRRISIEEEMWESLEWDDDIRHKHLLQPFVQFIR